MSTATKIELLQRNILSLRKQREQLRVALSANVTLTVSELSGFYIRSNTIRDLLVEQDKSLEKELTRLEGKVQQIEGILNEKA